MMQAINKHSLENGSDTPDFIIRSVKPIGLQPMGCKRLTLSEDVLTDGIW